MSQIGKSVEHDSALGHATGAARYVADIPLTAGELWAGFAGSPAARGRIRAIDTGAAMAVDDAAGVFTFRDIPGVNRFGGLEADEPFLAEDEVCYLNQPVVLVAAASREALDQARAAVRIDVDEQPPVTTIEEAIAREWFLGAPLRIARGDFHAAWSRAEHTLEGSLEIGGQDHCYFETQAAIAYPGEAGRIRLMSSTQNPSQIQKVVAAMLGVGMNQVVVECPRLGGGFGGKETQGAIPAVLAALAAARTGRPARVIYSRTEDMRSTGKRHPYRSRWKAGFDSDGLIRCASIDFRSNGGAYTDLSPAVMERSALHADNAYFIPDIEVTGRACRTNLPPNTALRGFGGPQAAVTIETIVEKIAIHLGVDACEVRRRNLYGGEGRDTTHYGQRVENHRLPEIFERLTESSGYRDRRVRIREQNARSRTVVRGIAMTPLKFGISFTTTFLNQASALVHVFTDGTVQVSTGATEMGQGVNTKIRQLVAAEFDLPVEHVAMMPASTEKNINTPPTAASASADLNGAAAVRACAEIRGRLEKLRAQLIESGRIPNADIPFAELVSLAHRERVDLGARAFFATPGIGWDRTTGRGRPFYYFTTGAAVAEVAIDRFTGELRVDRVDVLMDIGRSLNPAIDRGQIIGGLMQGIGWVSMEDLRYDGARLLTGSLSTYKIPAITDVPEDLRIEFLEGGGESRNIGGSKAVGEPPFLLGISVWAAVLDAISSLHPGVVAPLALPATAERILLCAKQMAGSGTHEGSAPKPA